MDWATEHVLPQERDVERVKGAVLGRYLQLRLEPPVGDYLDRLVALFTHFIPPGVWEAIYIIDALMKNRSKIQPDTVFADTPGANEVAPGQV
jgi:hypothetical protein